MTPDHDTYTELYTACLAIEAERDTLLALAQDLAKAPLAPGAWRQNRAAVARHHYRAPQAQGAQAHVPSSWPPFDST